MKPRREADIVGYGAYVPRFRTIGFVRAIKPIVIPCLPIGFQPDEITTIHEISNREKKLLGAVVCLPSLRNPLLGKVHRDPL
jgi:hypothetical protein